jgi:hypothetical protein
MSFTLEAPQRGGGLDATRPKLTRFSNASTRPAYRRALQRE